MVDSVDHFSVYLIGTDFTIETDHKALEFLNTAKTVTGRLARWALLLHSSPTKSYTVLILRTGMQMAFLARHGIDMKLQINLFQ